MRFTLKPLAQHEQALAAIKHDTVEKFLSYHKLSFDEYYDVVVFRYLQTVERWFREPRLYKYEFSTIAWKAMSSALHSELKKRNRRIPTVSIDGIVPGTDDMTWADIVTKDNLDYIPYVYGGK